ncbi:hypothetical protein E2C01_059536 [Portunus trituberculatus]|uniref:Uncharacterized protein n=1 Tax=Portunus trituberculatus TaxID=210409 RepID=A0A5B7H2V0_PORTR|nr:hypothetical protein [Portunus trituberculatus]
MEGWQVGILELRCGGQVTVADIGRDATIPGIDYAATCLYHQPTIITTTTITTTSTPTITTTITTSFTPTVIILVWFLYKTYSSHFGANNLTRSQN